MTSDGASPAEQIVEAVRRNNVDLLTEVLESIENEDKRAEIINSARDPIGNSPLHLGALNGSYEAVDLLLEQHGVEVDPVNRLEQDTPLHSVVRYSISEPEHGAFMAEVLIEAGCDPRVRNKNKQKPIDLCDNENVELINILRGAEYAAMVGPTAEEEDDEDEQGEQGEDGSGSGTD